MTTGLPPDILAALNQLEPQMMQAFLDACAKVTSTAQMQTIVGHLQAGNIEAAVTALRLDPSFYAPLDQMMQNAHFQGGVMALAGLPKINDPFPVARSFSASMADISGPKRGRGSNHRG